MVGRAQERGLLSLHGWNPRDYAEGNYRRVDDRPFGGGPGMVMLIDPLRACLRRRARGRSGAGARSIYLSPQGAPLTQAKVRELAGRERLILLCGRYEGIDERLIAAEVDEEISIGDYVLSGGELAAAVVIDAVARLQEGALNDAESAVQDSFEDGLLDCPHYTRPVEHALGDVPEVLLSGNHAEIAALAPRSSRWAGPGAPARTCWTRPPCPRRTGELLEALRAGPPAGTGRRAKPLASYREKAAIMRGFAARHPQRYRAATIRVPASASSCRPTRTTNTQTGRP